MGIKNSVLLSLSWITYSTFYSSSYSRECVYPYLHSGAGRENSRIEILNGLQRKQFDEVI